MSKSKFILIPLLFLLFVVSCSRKIVKTDAPLGSLPASENASPSPTAVAGVSFSPEFLNTIEQGKAYWEQAVPPLVREWGGEGSEKGQFKEPTGLALDKDGNVWVTDSLNRRIQVFDNDGNFLRIFPETVENSPLTYPAHIAVDPEGVVYVSDVFHQSVFKFDPTGKLLDTWREKIGTAKFKNIYAIALDSQRNVYLADSNNDRVLKVSPEGKLLQIIREKHRGKNLGGDTHAGLMVDRSGNLYVSDTPRASVGRYDGAGHYLGRWGIKGFDDFGFRPGNLSSDDQGHLYAVDGHCGGYRVEVFDPEGTYLGGAGSGGDTPGHFRSPGGLGVDKNGNIFVSDTRRNCVVKYGPFDFDRLSKISSFCKANPGSFVRETSRSTKSLYGVRISLEKEKWLPLTAPVTLEGYMDLSEFRIEGKPTDRSLRAAFALMKGVGRDYGYALYGKGAVVKFTLGGKDFWTIDSKPPITSGRAKVVDMGLLPDWEVIEGKWMLPLHAFDIGRLWQPHKAILEVPYEFTANYKHFKGTYFFLSNDARYGEKELRGFAKRCRLDSIYGKGNIYLHHDSYKKNFERLEKVYKETDRNVLVIHLPEFEEFYHEKEESDFTFTICY